MLVYFSQKLVLMLLYVICVLLTKKLFFQIKSTLFNKSLLNNLLILNNELIINIIY